MDKITDTKSKNLTEENIAQLKQLFPSVFGEGKIDFTKLQQVLGENLEENKEYYRFTWPGKRQAINEALKQSIGTLRPVKEDSVNWDSTQNLYIEGDNLEVLKLLQKSYYNKVKMIYIDPPYNTGKDFVYKDNYKDNLAEYNEKFNRTDEYGNIISSETNDEGNARYHSNWLNMMYPRLQLARNLLTDDGVIFMSIDDHEVHNLRKIADEIFGENNVDLMIWNKEAEGSSGTLKVTKRYRKIHEYIVVVYKNKNCTQFSKINEALIGRENEFQTANLAVNAEKENKDHENYFSIKNPNGNIFTKQWKWNKEEVDKLIKDDLIYWGSDGNRQPRLIIPTDERRKTYLLSILNYGGTTTGRKDFESLFSDKIEFSYPKPIILLNKIINTVSQNKNDIILDFFSGSATTAHATMKLNAEDGGNRKFIMVQLPEATEEKSEAYKAGYKNICEIGKERIRRAGTKIKEELIAEGKTAEAKKLDIGFKVLRLDSSNMYSWEKSPEELEQNLNLFKDSVIKPERSTEDVLYEVLLKYGLDLTYPIETITIDNKTVYSVGFGQLLICLDQGITRNTAKEMVSWIKENDLDNTQIVFDENNFTNDVEKTNAIVLFKENGINDVKSI